MSKFRKLAHLEERLGPERFDALIDSENTGKVKDFCDKLLKPEPTVVGEMVLGGVTFEILSFLNGKRKKMDGETLLGWAKTAGASLGSEDRRFIMANQKEIPAHLRKKLVFIFDAEGDGVKVLSWKTDGWGNNGHWDCNWDSFGEWSDYCRFLRRKS